MRISFTLALVLAVAAPANAQNQTPVRVENVIGEFGVPVVPYDITDRPYTVIGEVHAGVRKATIFSKSPSQEKIYKELWERAQKLGADAVIKAEYGDFHASAISWGKTKATGIAVKFLPATSAQPRANAGN
jgi:uncharacterized protein YbjQ (UPF0145 family)